jgi:NitT/TauT family transport system permease protein
MSRLRNWTAWSAALLGILSCVFPVAFAGDEAIYWTRGVLPMFDISIAILVALASFVHDRRHVSDGVLAALAAAIGAVPPMVILSRGVTVGGDALGFWLQILAVTALAWRALSILSTAAAQGWIRSILVPGLFGLWVLFVWQVGVGGFDVPPVLLPSPSRIGQLLVENVYLLWQDFRQTFLKSVLAGYFLGSGAGFVVAILVDRSPFLQRGLLPLGSLVSAIPVVGIAPIMVMWFGFDWQSKAAVIVVMTFFPMLVNSLAGLANASDIERDLMHSYAASYWQTLAKLRLPSALPFIFNALKINSTLALIGAIVAEFFGTPVVGMGFRISVEIGRMNVDMVWATIAVAALAGSAFYGIVALLERGLTFWHPSYRVGHS